MRTLWENYDVQFFWPKKLTASFSEMASFLGSEKPVHARIIVLRIDYRYFLTRSVQSCLVPGSTDSTRKLKSDVSLQHGVTILFSTYVGNCTNYNHFIATIDFAEPTFPIKLF